LLLDFTIFESVTFFGTIHDAQESNGSVEILAIGNAQDSLLGISWLWNAAFISIRGRISK
jgi:hypothetical protein